MANLATHAGLRDLDLAPRRDGYRSCRVTLKALSNGGAAAVNAKRLAHRLVQSFCGEYFMPWCNIERSRIGVVGEGMFQVVIVAYLAHERDSLLTGSEGPLQRQLGYVGGVVGIHTQFLGCALKLKLKLGTPPKWRLWSKKSC
jgi:hypothetical protein